MSRYILIALLLIPVTVSDAQGPIGSWMDHLPYNSVLYVAGNENVIFGSTEYAITVYDREYNELKKLSKTNGLTECGISTIAYSSNKNALVIAYNSGNIDLYRNGEVRNIPDILNTSVAGDKSINRIRPYGNYAYLATNLGIIIIDIESEEIKDTWRPSVEGSQNEIFDICILSDTIFAATENGLFKAFLNNPGLSYYSNWDIINGTENNIYNCLASLNNRIFVNHRTDNPSSDDVYYYANGTFNLLNDLSEHKKISFESYDNNLIICSGNDIKLLDSDGDVTMYINSYGDQEINPGNAAIIDDDIYIADRNQGLIELENGSEYIRHVPDGPYFANCYNIATSGGQVWVAGGTVNAAWNNTWTTFRVFNHSDRQWSSYLRYDAWDVMNVEPVPSEPGHVYISTWGSGIFEYNNNELINHWAEDQLGSIIPGRPYVRTCGIALDRDNFLWITQSGIQNNIKVLIDGSWIALPYYIDAPTIGDILITGSNKKWIVLPRGHGLYVLDDNYTPANFDDDRYKKLVVKDQDGKLLSNIYSIAEDLDGNIWIGTDQGPAVFYNPDNVFDQTINATRIKVPRNDGSGFADYLLGTETVLSIAVDGGNRKWLGTNSSGAFLISGETNELIKSYNESNSPLPSDQVISVAVDGSTGEVWFGTGKGLVSVRETGSEGSGNMENVYAFPNPVREDFTGKITITGLTRNANVKITDISGNLVYETTSTGGDATWDMKTYNGARVSTGVYLIFSTNESASVSTVTKILIIK